MSGADAGLEITEMSSNMIVKFDVSNNFIYAKVVSRPRPVKGTLRLNGTLVTVTATEFTQIYPR